MSKAYKFPTLHHAKADRLLLSVQEAEQELERLETAAAAEMKIVQQAWAAKIEYQRGRVDWLDQELKDFEKDQRADLFGDSTSSRVTLPHGVLLYDKTDYVVKPRKVNVLERLERYGFEEAIKRTAAVNWEALEDKEEWPDEVLAIIGTRRESKETFGYELNEPEPQAGAGENA